ncbi:MAG: glutathione S-transferase family protein [Pseudomonadota bacterium]
MLVNGKWSAAWTPVQAKDEDGRFVRQTSSFRSWVTPDGAPGPDGSAGFPAEPGRYHLYVALICPWASRALMARKLKRLDDVISVSVVEPALTEQGWRFGDHPGAGSDPHLGATYMHEIYTHSDAGFTGRATVPVLWDKETRRIVNNESADILRMLNSAFDAFGDASVDLYPAAHAAEIDALNPVLYDRLNNGVYKAGFASSQLAHDEAVRGVFETLDALEARLSDGRAYLFGDALTETDVRVFVTLVRFDPAYHGLFKCNLKSIAEYPRLSAYADRIGALPGVRETVDLDHIKVGYHSIAALNPTGVVPLGPLRAPGAPWLAADAAANGGRS